ncbi:hypothetical protein JXL21_03835 [Candidatus Bathyarchaeota archaeon]|nr:hypothetical protein [Candidatus Bathyarchaeota archaeon]
MSYFKKEDDGQKKKIIAAGVVIVMIFGVAGTQMCINGREYASKVKHLEARGFELNGTLAWEDMGDWEDYVYEKLRNGINIERRQVETWEEFYSILRGTKNVAVYDNSLYDGVHNCDESFVIWFSTIYLRGSRRGSLTTYYIFPDGNP